MTRASGIIWQHGISSPIQALLWNLYFVWNAHFITSFTYMHTLSVDYIDYGCVYLLWINMHSFRASGYAWLCKSPVPIIGKILSCWVQFPKDCWKVSRFAWWDLADFSMKCWKLCLQIDRLVQERRNSSALAMELRLSCTNPSKYVFAYS